MAKDFIRSYNDESDQEYFLEVDVQYAENAPIRHSDLHSLLERMKIGKPEETCMIKKKVLCT